MDTEALSSTPWEVGFLYWLISPPVDESNNTKHYFYKDSQFQLINKSAFHLSCILIPHIIVQFYYLFQWCQILTVSLEVHVNEFYGKISSEGSSFLNQNWWQNLLDLFSFLQASIINKIVKIHTKNADFSHFSFSIRHNKALSTVWTRNKKQHTVLFVINAT